MKISRESAFNILRTNRQAAALEAKSFAIRSVNKDGSVSRSADNALTTASTEEEAAKVLSRMQQLNPGRKFVIVSK